MQIPISFDRMKDITPETRVKFTAKQLYSICIALVLAAFAVGKFHSDAMHRFDALTDASNKQAIALVEYTKSVDTRFELYALKKQVEDLHMHHLRRFHVTNEAQALYEANAVKAYLGVKE
jgi:hypothetical protein